MVKIETLSQSAQDKVFELKGKGMSNSAIADQVNQEFGSDLTYGDVFAYFNKRQDKAIKALKESGQFEKKMAEKYFDTIDQLGNLNAELWEFFYNLKSNPAFKEKILRCEHCTKPTVVKIDDHSILLKSADHLLKQIAHVDSILGRLQKKSLTISYNVVDLNKKIEVALPDFLNRLEREGRLDGLITQIKKKRKLVTLTGE